MDPRATPWDPPRLISAASAHQGASVMSGPVEFHQLLDASPDAMVVVDRNGRVTALNREAERFFGWTEIELLGQQMNRFIPTRFHPLLGPDLETHNGLTS